MENSGIGNPADSSNSSSLSKHRKINKLSIIENNEKSSKAYSPFKVSESKHTSKYDPREDLRMEVKSKKQKEADINLKSNKQVVAALKQ